MSDVLGKNLALLRQAQPGFTPIDPLDVVRCDERGVWGLYSQRYPNGLAIHSREPQREADRIAAQLLDGVDSDVIVVVGLGMGYLLEALDRRAWAGKVIAFEFIPETVRPMLERRDWSSWFGPDRLRVLVWPEYAGGRGCWRWLGDGSNDVPTYVHAAMASLRPEGVSDAKAMFDRIRFDAKANADARRQFAPRYLQNTLRNLSAIASEADVRWLDGAAPGLPAIVVAAGPSLDRALPALREVQGSAVIVCVDTALRVLANAGIAAHAVVAVDPSESNARHLTDLPDTGATCLVCEGSLDPVVAPGFRGRTFFLSVSNHHPWPWLQGHGYRAGELRAFGSVLTTAFDLAVRMQCDPIVFVGADLSYTNNRPYGRGVTYEDDWRRRAQWGQPIEQQWQDAIDMQPRASETNVVGEDVRTAPHLIAFRDWLATEMATDTSHRYVNATGAGILRGDRIDQAPPESLPALLGTERQIPADVVSRHHRPITGAEVMEAARRLLCDLRNGATDADPIVQQWMEFAPGLSREQIVQALADALAPPAADRAGLAPTGAAYGQIAMMDSWLQPLIESVPLVPMILPPHRFEKTASGARVFRFRTLAARLIGCMTQPPDDGVTEDGQPLRKVDSLDLIEPGTFTVCRDEVHFKAIDGSDPRSNRRTYVVMVPSCVAELEQLPIHDILARNL